LQTRSDIIKRYRIKSRDVIGGIPSGEFNTSSPYLAWLAGKSYKNLNTDFLSGMAYRFLYTSATPRRISPNQLLYVEFITLDAGTGISLRLNATYTDNTTQLFTYSLGNVNAYTAYGYKIAPPAYTKEVKSFTISLFGFTSTMESISCSYTQKNLYETEIFYLNSLGGYENCTFTGKTEFSETHSADAFEAQLYPPLNAQKGNYQTFNQKGNEVMVLRSGWVTKEERKGLIDLTLRNEAYLRESLTLEKMLLANGTRVVSKDGEFLYSLEINARFAYDNDALSRV
jgi:hypothetical protein